MNDKGSTNNERNAQKLLTTMEYKKKVTPTDSTENIAQIYKALTTNNSIYLRRRMMIIPIGDLDPQIKQEQM